MTFQLTRKLKIILLAVVGALLLYAALGFWLVPRILRGQIQDFTAQHWQRQPALGEISFNPFTLTVQVHDFAFADSTGAPLLSFDRLLVNLDISSLWRRGLSFHEIELDRPAGSTVVRADGSLNLAELTQPFARPEAAEPADGDPLRVFIDHLRLQEGVFEFEDHARSTPFKARLTPVTFALEDFSTVAGSGNLYSLQAQSTAGERFRWSGSFGLAPLSSRGEFELTDVQARTLWSYLQESLGFEVSSGIVGVRGGYEFAATEPQLTMAVSLATVAVNELKLRARGGDEDWVALDSLALANGTVDVARRQVDIGSLRLDGGSLSARRDARGAINLLTLLEAPATQPEPTTAPPPAADAGDARDAPPEQTPWVVNAPDIVVDQLRIALDDQFVKPAAAFTLAPVKLVLRDFSTAPGRPLELELDLALESGGALSVRGRGTPADTTFAGHLKLDDLNLTALQPYIGTYTQMTLLNGKLSAALDTEFANDALRVAGDIRSAGLHTVDNALREDFIKWDALALTGFEYRTQPRQAASLRIANITTRAPYVRFIIAPDQTTNVGKVLTQPQDAPGPVQTVQGQTSPGATQPLNISIGKVQVENGSANFADFWITPNYAVSIQQLSGSVSGLSSRKDSRARLALTGKIDRHAPVEIGGELNLLSASLFTDIHVKFDGVELTSVTPYSGRFAGYRIEKGKLSVDVRYQVEDRKLNAEQRFIVDQLTLGEKVDSPDAVNLPLRLAVALLKDRNGVIDLGLPITGSLDDPKFRLGPIIWKAFVNLLTGVATSPFKMLGNLFGGGEEVNLIDFAPGEATLDAAGAEKLAALGKALTERPQLALEVPATFAPDADYPVLATRQLEEKLRNLPAARKAGGDAADPAALFELLLDLYKKEKSGAALPAAAQALQATRGKDRDPAALETANQELQAALLPPIDTLDPALQALAQARARAIQDALLSAGEIDPARVFMLAVKPQPASGDRVRAALSLK